MNRDDILRKLIQEDNARLGQEVGMECEICGMNAPEEVRLRLPLPVALCDWCYEKIDWQLAPQEAIDTALTGAGIVDYNNPDTKHWSWWMQCDSCHLLTPPWKIRPWALDNADQGWDYLCKECHDKQVAMRILRGEDNKGSIFVNGEHMNARLISTHTITAGKIAAGTITAAKIQAGAISPPPNQGKRP